MGFLILIALLILAFFAGRWQVESRFSKSGISAATVGAVAAKVRTDYPDDVLAMLQRLYPRRVIEG